MSRRTTTAALPPEHPARAIGQLTTRALAAVLGVKNARVARDWCRRHRIPCRRDGKFNWVSLDEILRALDALGAEARAQHESSKVAATRAAAAIMSGSRRRHNGT